MKFKKVGLPLFVFLVAYWIVAIFFIVFLVSLGVAVIFYLKSESFFYFDWVEESLYAIKKSVPGGGVLGAGIWIKAWLQERKNKKNLSK